LLVGFSVLSCLIAERGRRALVARVEARLEHAAAIRRKLAG
jgi:hypothetical protein